MQGWSHRALSEVTSAPIVYGIVQPGEPDPTGVPFVQTRDIAGDLDLERLDHVGKGVATLYRRSAIRTGDVLVALRGQIGSSAIVPGTLDGANISRGVARLRVSTDKAHPDFIHQALQTSPVRRAMETASRGSTLREISIGALRAISVPLPPLPEQRKIAEILGTWDEAVEKTEALRNAAASRQANLARSAFENATSGRWSTTRLSAVSRRILRKNDGGSHPITTISSKAGFVAQADKYSRDMAGASAATYTLLFEGEFAYNKGNSLSYPQGCLFALKQPSALVPSVYFSFALDPSLNPRFYEHFFAHGGLNKQLSQRINSGVRNNGLLNISADEFFSVLLPVPERAEQDLVARYLDASSEELARLDRQIALLKEQKRGLMQKLLTGDIRVTVDPTEEVTR